MATLSFDSSTTIGGRGLACRMAVLLDVVIDVVSGFNPITMLEAVSSLATILAFAEVLVFRVLLVPDVIFEVVHVFDTIFLFRIAERLSPLLWRDLVIMLYLPASFQPGECQSQMST